MYQVDQSAYWQSQLLYWGPKILIALAILVLTWIVARAVKWVIQKAIDRSPALRKHVTGTPEETVGHQLGVIAKLIVWLVGIMAALRFLGVGQILAPIDNLLNQIFAFLPRLIGAGLIFFVGLIVARILRRLTETLVTTINLDGLLARVGLSVGAPAPASTADTSSLAPRASIAKALGILVFALIIFPIAIAALQALGIESVSGQASELLDQILLAIPPVLSAALWIGIAFVLGRFVKSILEAVLSAFGFDRAVHSIGMVPPGVSPSRVLANIGMVAVVLFGLIEGMKQLGGGTIAIFLAQVTELGGKVIFGSLIIVTGIFLARIIANLVGSGTGERSYAQTIVRYAIIALFTAIGLTFMGLADQIVMLAFGLILGSAAIATALAFGLGGRDWAARKLEDMSGSKTSHRVPPRAADDDNSLV